MNYRSKDFELERTEFADTLMFKKTNARLTFASGELEQLFRFLGPLYEDIIFAVAPPPQVDSGREEIARIIEEHCVVDDQDRMYVKSLAAADAILALSGGRG